mmetsp:Transcript_16938/g.23479  ORF Transcript_16938/g.23479 Transcript_16938/m.23479 type:complete len:247 (-) Transcript_16938:482-1222(-)
MVSKVEWKRPKNFVNVSKNVFVSVPGSSKNVFLSLVNFCSIVVFLAVKSPKLASASSKKEEIFLWKLSLGTSSPSTNLFEKFRSVSSWFTSFETSLRLSRAASWTEGKSSGSFNISGLFFSKTWIKNPKRVVLLSRDFVSASLTRSVSLKPYAPPRAPFPFIKLPTFKTTPKNSGSFLLPETSSIAFSRTFICSSTVEARFSNPVLMSKAFNFASRRGISPRAIKNCSAPPSSSGVGYSLIMSNSS